MQTRDSEDELIKRCLRAAEENTSATDANEADVFRLVAQLVKTRHPAVAAALEQANRSYYAVNTSARQKTYPEVVRAGLVSDLPRLRNLLNHRLTTGRDTW